MLQWLSDAMNSVNLLEVGLHLEQTALVRFVSSLDIWQKLKYKWCN